MNFVLPIDLARLQNDRLWLQPIDLCTDEQLNDYITQSNVEYPEVWQHYACGPFASAEEYKRFYEKKYASDSGTQHFAIFLKAGTICKGDEQFDVKHGTFAGTTGLMHTSVPHSTTEIGWVMVAPRFHRTFVNTHANCLLLKHMLGPLKEGDLQLRRVQWQAHSENKGSIKAAQRLGFTMEGIIRWANTMWPNKTCQSTRSGSCKDDLPIVDFNGTLLGPGRHSAMLSMCWDDWVSGKREHVLGLLSRG